MEQTPGVNFVRATENKMSLLKYFWILLYAIVGSLVIVAIRMAIFGQTDYSEVELTSLQNIEVAFSFGVLAILPLALFLGRRFFLVKTKVFLFLLSCTFSQLIAIIFAMFSVLPIFLITFLLELIPGFKSPESIVLISTLFVPAIASAGIITISIWVFFSGVTLIKKSDVMFLMMYHILYLLILTFFSDIMSFGNLMRGGGQVAVDAQAFLLVSFFWQVGMLYFIGAHFSRYAFLQEESPKEA